MSLKNAEGFISLLSIKPDGVSVAFEVTVNRVMIGPKGFERDFTPTVLEYLYERKEISYIWGAFVFVWGAAWGARKLLFS